MVNESRVFILSSPRWTEAPSGLVQTARGPTAARQKPLRMDSRAGVFFLHGSHLSQLHDSPVAVSRPSRRESGVRLALRHVPQAVEEVLEGVAPAVGHLREGAFRVGKKPARPPNTFFLGAEGVSASKGLRKPSNLGLPLQKHIMCGFCM